MRQKERKSMDRPHRLHPVGTTRSPLDVDFNNSYSDLDE
ncbi:hypothetical protein Ahy_B09g096727 [Arachis hypogaea]|uniref:Uncharacterized protein n=1 Tax=Arachis hypogaea TaxID=3818 RepID=A0A444XLY5_ARAHY|nr:hypothetical protein Ahy_B09g096727 [Arachis hypogaea]